MTLGDGRQPGLNRGFSGDPEGLLEWFPVLTKMTGKHITDTLTALLCLYIS